MLPCTVIETLSETVHLPTFCSLVYRCCQCRRNRDAQLRATINQKLIETGERDRYVDVLNSRWQCFV